MNGPTLIASGATCGLLHAALEPRGAVSPIGFEATMNVAMELENELKTPRSPEEEEEEQRHDTNGTGVMEVKQELDCDRSEGEVSPTRVMEELMEEEDDEDVDSLCPSTVRSNGSFDGEMSPGMPSLDNSKEEDDADSFQKLHGALERNGLQTTGSGSHHGLNGSGRPDSVEGDYYEGSESSQHPLYSRPGLHHELGGDEQQQCHLCPFTTRSKFQLNAHLSSHYDNKCNHCDYTSRTEGRLKRHMKDFHADLAADDFSPDGALKGGVQGDTNGGSAQNKVKTYRCKQCSYVATVKTDFWDHSKTHIKAEKLLTCPNCPFVTEYKHHLEYHLRNHYGSKPFRCPKCNYSCVNKSMLNSHMKSHSNIYQYRCANCSYATKYCHSLKLHLRKYAHTPSTVLNADGTPNPIPVIDVYGTRRGPRTKKAQDELYANAGSNGGNGGLPFSPLQLAGNGALSPSAVLPFFYQGASTGLTNGFHPNAEGGHMHQRNLNLSPPSVIIGSTGSAEDDESVDSKRHHSPGDAGPFKCTLCDFSTEHRDAFGKHILLHATSDNQDLFNLYGINSDALLQDPGQHSQMEAVVATVMGIGSQQQQPHRADLYRHHPFNLLQMQNGKDAMQQFNFHKGAKPQADEPPRKSPQPQAPNPLEHLRAFSEQVNVKPYMVRDFSANLFASPLLAQNNPGVKAVSPSSTSPQTSPPLNGSSAKVPRHPPTHPKNPKHGAVRASQTTPDNHHSLGPLDLSSAKVGPRPPGAISYPFHLSPQQFPFAQQLQRYPLSPAYLQQQQQQHQQQLIVSQGALEICTSAPPPGAVAASPSPNQTKNRRKGKAFKLDRLCMKLQKEQESPVGQLGLTDDSMEDGDVSKTSDAGEDRNAEPSKFQEPSKNGDISPETNGKPKLSPLGECAEPTTKLPLGDAKNVDAERVLASLVDAKVVVRGKDPWSEAYQCHYCDMAFKDCVMYTVHMGYHGYKDPFKCNMCGLQTKDKVDFFLHIARSAHL